jgi:hypothetical protein
MDILINSGRDLIRLVEERGAKVSQRIWSALCDLDKINSEQMFKSLNQQPQPSTCQPPQIRTAGFLKTASEIADIMQRRCPFLNHELIDALAADITAHTIDSQEKWNEKLIWLWTHCRAIGMTQESNVILKEERKGSSKGMELDIALFTSELVKELATFKTKSSDPHKVHLAQVILSNDVPQAVTLGDEEEATELMDKLKHIHYEVWLKQHDLLNNSTSGTAYESQFHWHIRSVLSPPLA